MSHSSAHLLLRKGQLADRGPPRSNSSYLLILRPINGLLSLISSETKERQREFYSIQILTFDRLEGQIDEAQLSIEGLRWDAAIIRHDAPSIEIVIAEWFEKWFDPAEINFDASAELSECIHAVYITRQELQIDFGTATAEAFWELLECLSNSGATSISVSS
jgi:hypothetical protein